MSSRKITITAGGVTAAATLNDSAMADKIWAALPITGRASTWGDEIYFSIPVKAAEAPGADSLVDLGDIAFWPPGSAFCIFFGITPASDGDEIRAASPVNVFGRIDGDPAIFRAVDSGAKIEIIKA